MIPVLAHAPAHLRKFEILAQPFARPHQIVRKERLSLGVAAPRQQHQRAFRHDMAPARLRVGGGGGHRLFGLVARPETGLRLGETAQLAFLFGQQLAERGAPGGGDPVA